MAKGHIFYRKVFFHFIMCGSSGTKSDVVVAAGRYELVHISTGATNTSRLRKGRPHIMKCIFFLIDNPGRCCACPGLIGISLSGYSFLNVFEYISLKIS